MKFNKLILIATSLFLLFVACHKDHDDPDPSNTTIAKDTVYISGSQNMDGAYVVDTIIVKRLDPAMPVAYLKKNNKFYVIPLSLILGEPIYKANDTLTYNFTIADTIPYFTKSIYIMDSTNSKYGNYFAFGQLNNDYIPNLFFSAKQLTIMNLDSVHFNDMTSKLVGGVKFDGIFNLINNTTPINVIDTNVHIWTTKIKLNHKIE